MESLQKKRINRQRSTRRSMFMRHVRIGFQSLKLLSKILDMESPIPITPTQQVWPLLDLSKLARSTLLSMQLPLPMTSLMLSPTLSTSRILRASQLARRSVELSSLLMSSSSVQNPTSPLQMASSVPLLSPTASLMSILMSHRKFTEK